MRWKAWIGLLVSALFLYLSVQKVDLDEMKIALHRAHYLYLIPSSLLLLLGFWVRAYRWKFLLKPVKIIPTRDLFAATMIGFMGNNVLPARLGELMRADAIGRRASLSRTTAFATIIIERLFDGMTLLLFLVGTLSLSVFPDWIRRGGMWALGLYVLLIAVLYLFHIRTSTAVGFIEYLLRPLPDRLSERLVVQLQRFALGLDVLSQPGRLISTSFLSLVLWVINVASIHCIMEAFALDLPAYAAFTVIAVLSLGVSLPSSPGFVGVFQGFCIVALALFGVSRSVALGFSIVLHVSGYVPVTAIGLLYFWKAHLSFKGIKMLPKEGS